MNRTADCFKTIVICPFFELHIPQTWILPQKFGLPGYLLKSVGRKNIGWCLNGDWMNENMPKLLKMVPFLSYVLFCLFCFVLSSFVWFFWLFVFLAFVPGILCFSCFNLETVANSSVWFLTYLLVLWMCLFKCKTSIQWHTFVVSSPRGDKFTIWSTVIFLDSLCYAN